MMDAAAPPDILRRIAERRRERLAEHRRHHPDDVAAAAALEEAPPPADTLTPRDNAFLAALSRRRERLAPVPAADSAPDAGRSAPADTLTARDNAFLAALSRRRGRLAPVPAADSAAGAERSAPPDGRHRGATLDPRASPAGPVPPAPPAAPALLAPPALPALPAIIAEVKMGSPRLGSLLGRLDPLAQARCYAAGGAAALSVVVEPDFFHGDYELLAACRAACGLPAIAKDFVVDPLQLLWARRAGADAVLLIAALHRPEELARYAWMARGLGLVPLIETHDAADLALLAGEPWELVGINNRDLRTFEVDLERSIALLPWLPRGALRVAESGIRDALDVALLADSGFDALLIGESLLLAADPGAALRALLGAAADAPPAAPDDAAGPAGRTSPRDPANPANPPSPANPPNPATSASSPNPPDPANLEIGAGRGGAP